MENRNKQEEKKTSELFKVQGDWAKQSNALKEKYPKLTSEDVKFETGKETDLFKRLETRLEKNRNEVIGILKTNHQACS
ncbi:hypothetical protein LS482_02560 [Sinomicrobium kalidii]|uniref:hypothetical protein n=1 Tax=Sinomicrobium kalidii TaxID=2900738 RepID=UPI001E2C4B8F|nr:hypothetical protein [Sinomicrobium kalidii]UGU16763.1 hypothetical protein LS482_02560 [Sinomicrobium kalidii]